MDPEQMIRYACLLLDIADEKSHKRAVPFVRFSMSCFWRSAAPRIDYSSAAALSF